LGFHALNHSKGENMSDEKQIKDFEDQSLVEMEAYRTGEGQDSVVSPDNDMMDDLKNIAGMFKAARSDPDEISESVDNVVLEHIRAKSQEIRRDRKVVHLFPRYKWAAAAVMGVLVCVVSFNLLYEKDKSAETILSKQVSTVSAGLSKDIDGNGRIDIIDAYLLNNSLKNGSATSKQLDMNRDGLINNEDIDDIAYTAVSLKRSEV
jgi:hypothetical protein